MKKYLSVIIGIAGCLWFWGFSQVTEIEFNTLFHEADAKAMEEIVNLFQQLHPEIKVRLVQGRWAQYYAELRLSVIAGNPPQLGICHVNRLVEMVDYLTPFRCFACWEPFGTRWYRSLFIPPDYLERRTI